ncbi:DNA cytosine methyltransferase [Pontibacillus halophilus]|uniref:DNA cytosine methyltransferase n=1 Tax=Pontibacillus halophilus TaxID=516704 RepID=UPI000415D743|nr:DNA cytosine methyltransferase [Pontibacillus halophilus]
MNQLLKLKKVYSIGKKSDNPRLFFRHMVCEAANWGVGDEVYVHVNEEEREIVLQNQPFTKDYEAHSIHVSYSINKHSGEKRPLIDTARDSFTSIISIKEKAEVCVFKKGTLHQVVVRPLKFNLFSKDEVELREDKRSDERLKLLSIGAGAGVGTASFIDTQYFTPVQEIELEDDSAENLMLNYPNSYVFVGDLRDCNEVAKADVALCTLPCNSHSSLGRMDGDVFENLILGTVDLLRAAEPSVIVFENVPRFYESSGYQYMKEALQDKFPYWVEKKIDSYEFGSSIARRNRTYAVACQSEEVFYQFEFPSLPSKPKRRKLKEYLDHKSVKHEWKSMEKWMASFESREAFRNRSLEKTFITRETKGPLQCLLRRYTSHCPSNSYLLSEDKKQWRFLSINEIRRILNVPDWFEFSKQIPVNRVYEMLGQSVDGGVIKAIGNKVASSIFKAKQRGMSLVTKVSQPLNPVSIRENGQVELVF